MIARQIIAVFLLAGLSVGVAGGAEVVLRADAVLSGSIVRLGDVADVTSAVAGEAAELAAIPLLPAPAPGTQVFLSVTQLRDMLAANAVAVGALDIRGAATVAITTPAINAPPRHNGIEIASERPEREEVQTQVAAAIVQYLHEKTGHDLWNVKVGVEPKLVDLYWRAGSQVIVSGGQAPWIGRQRFNVAAADAKSAGALKTFVTVERIEMAVTALRPIAAGDFVRATDVALRPYAGRLSDLAARSLEEVIGKEAQHAIRPDAILLTSHVRAPLLVKRGERVSVQARAGGIVVRTYGTVQQDGSLGDLVQVQTLEGRERYAARVSGVRELEVFAAGASAEEVAAAAR